MPTIAYLGPERTNCHMAAVKQFGRKAQYDHAATVEDVFRLVERRDADYGVVPIENSLEGAVTHTLDRFVDFMDTPVTIHGEIECRIEHYFILHQGVKLSRVAVVLSHPQALAQCSRWLDRHVGSASRYETHSTAEAVESLFTPTLLPFSRRTESAWTGTPPRYRAAIARREAAGRRGLRILPIPEERENKTRFLIIGLDEPKRGTRHKTSIVFVCNDQPGALHDALVPFKREGINLTKIESRPSKRKAWEYLFFVDMEGHESEPSVRRALKALERSTSLLRVLGSYPVSR